MSLSVYLEAINLFSPHLNQNISYWQESEDIYDQNILSESNCASGLFDFLEYIFFPMGILSHPRNPSANYLIFYVLFLEIVSSSKLWGVILYFGWPYVKTFRKISYLLLRESPSLCKRLKFCLIVELLSLVLVLWGLIKRTN